MIRVFFSILLVFLFFSCSNSRLNQVSVQIEELNTNTSASLRGLFVVNENVIWASGSEGTVLRSVDSGKTWQVFRVPNTSSNDFRSLYAWDGNRALVFGIAGPNYGYITEDGRESWQVVYTSTTEGLFFNSLKFANKNMGLAVSDPVDGNPFVIKTIDGGKHWKQVQNIPAFVNGEANFAASNTCIEFLSSGKAWIATGGSAARVFYSEDFGENWQVVETPVVQGNVSSGIFSICFENDLNGAIVGGTYDKPEQNENIAAYTIDGGKSWVLSEKMPAAYRSCVQPVPNLGKGFLFVIGKTGCDYSIDGGTTWNFISSEGYYTFRMVPDGRIGFVSANDGRMARIMFELY
jgi:photosystem II stability/assembly factor-like uncharacterized protein